MNQERRPTSWQLPVVLIVLMMSVPGVLPEADTYTKMMFILVGLTTWVVTECWGRNLVEAMLGLCRDAILFFVAQETQRTRVCIALTGIACSSYAITVGGYWWDKVPPDSLAGLFFLSVTWAVVEAVRFTTRQIDEQSAAEFAEQQPQYAVYDP